MMKKIIITLTMIATGLAGYAADPRFGVAVHVENQTANPNYNPASTLPVLTQSQISTLRDGDFPNWRKYELTQGVYTLNATEQTWIDQQSAAGYPIVFTLGLDLNHDYTPLFYTENPYPIQQAAAFVTWFVQQQMARGTLMAGFAVLNEPNNSFEGGGGAPMSASRRADYIALANAIYNGIHSLGAGAPPVIAGGSQGQDILYFLANGMKCDLVDVHPYDDGTGLPEHVYEGGPGTSNGGPWGTDYVQWVLALQSAIATSSNPNARIIETECGDDSNRPESNCAIWDVRRLTLAAHLGISKTFLYQFSSSDTGQSVVDYNRYPRQAWYATNELYALIGGMQNGQGVTFSSSDPNFSAVNTLGFNFVNGSAFTTIVWNKAGNPSQAFLAPTATATVSWPSATAPTGIDAVVLGSGQYIEGLTFTYSNGIVSVQSVPIGYDPVALFQVAPSGAPSVWTGPGQPALQIVNDSWSFGAYNGSGYIVLKNGVNTGGYANLLFNYHGSAVVVNARGQWWQWIGTSWSSIGVPTGF